jgi:cell division protein FtsB
MNETQRIAELEEQMRVLSREKRELEEKVKQLTQPRIYVATVGEWFWREVEDGRG